MIFWLVTVLLAVAVAVLAVAPLLRTPPRPDEEASDVALYRDQLEEIDRDLARGTIGAEEAERARTEVARRLLAADREGTRAAVDAPPRASRLAAALAALALAGGGVALYAVLGNPGLADRPLAARLERSEAMRANRMGQAEAEALVAERDTPVEPERMPQDYLKMVQQLRELVPGRPDDVEGWRLLARHEALLGDYAAAARAQEHLLELLGEEATTAERVQYADLLVAATQGYVSPEAEAVVRQVLDENPDEPGARYTMGLLYAQTDRPDVAFRLWRPVAEAGDPASAHTDLARAQIEAVAEAAGVDYRLPERTMPADLTPEAMVARLSNRLATQGGPASDWSRLITSLVVLGETDQAAAILAEARQVFSGSAEAMGVLDEAAAQAGLEE